jgi:choline-sulfatase
VLRLSRRGRIAAVLIVLLAPPLAIEIALGVRGWLRPPNIVMIVADTLRADRLGAYGSRRGLTPFLDELAARGTVFTNAYAASSWTCPSVASLFTSRYPSEHKVSDYDSKLSDAETTLVERLAERRYVAGGFSANFRLSRPLGYGQGFTRWFPYVALDKITTQRLARKSLAWVDVAWNWRARRPLLLYYQLMETHAPYDPAGEAHTPDRPTGALRARFCPICGDRDRTAALNARLTALQGDLLSNDDVTVLESLYDTEVASLDARLRGLFAGLERRGVLNKAIVVFTADHGEEFREHGQLGHGSSLFNELIHVPLIVLTPGQRAGRVVADNVSLVDVAPTILDLVGLAPMPTAEGRSLVPLFDGGAPPVDVVAEQLPIASSGLEYGRHRVAFLRGPLKLIVPQKAGTTRNRPVVYDLSRDPGETQPESAGTGYAACVRAARQAEARLAARSAPAEHGVVDERTREHLRALGYVN